MSNFRFKTVTEKLPDILKKCLIFLCLFFSRSEESSQDELVIQNIPPADTDVDVPSSECDDNVDGSQLNGNCSSK